MKFRLKDRALQEKLDAISGGDFSRQLKIFFDGRTPPITVFFSFVPEGKGGSFKFTATFQANEIEEVPEYDPNKWNPYPEVTPPECVPMRVEFRWNDGSIGRQCGIFKNRIWEIADDPDSEIDLVHRFRPWDDPEEEENEK